LNWSKLAVLALIVTLAGCASEPRTSDSAAGEEPAKVNRVEVEDVRYVFRNGNRIVTGELVNPGDRGIRHAMVQVALYDRMNQPVSMVNIDVRDIKAGERKPFRRVLDLNEDIRTVRVRSVLVL
jgi:hypothetical protein